MTPEVREALRVAERWLRLRYPPPRRLRVVVRVCRLRTGGSTTHPKNGRLFISIQQGLDNCSDAEEILLHEWAHMHTIDEEAEHGMRWRRRFGAYYSRWEDRGGRQEALRLFGCSR